MAAGTRVSELARLWEYKMAPVQAGEGMSLVLDLINAAGREGWEAVGAYGSYVLMKRPVPNPYKNERATDGR